jgi:uncharacterized protein YcbK (DUF882 family)
VRAAAALIVLLSAAPALAHRPDDKPNGNGKTDHAAQDRELRKRIGKPPPKIINVHYARNAEWIAVDADEKNPTLDQPVLDDFLRCAFTGDPAPGHMDGRLVGVLVKAAVHFKVDTIEIVSGFRAPKYNLMLRKKGHEVARESQHTMGHAVDFRLPGVDAKQLRNYVRTLHVGGVGYYPESQFVHADVGKIRYWVGR